MCGRRGMGDAVLKRIDLCNVDASIVNAIVDGSFWSVCL